MQVHFISAKPDLDVACGSIQRGSIHSGGYVSTDPVKVTCRNCRRTSEFLVAVSRT